MDIACRILWLLAVIVAVSTTVTSAPLRRQSQRPYPTHVFSTHPPGHRLVQHHHSPQRPPPFKPLPYHPKPIRIPKHPSFQRLPPNGPKKHYHKRRPPTFHKYRGSPPRPTPYHRPQHDEEEEDPPKHTIAMFLDKPKPSNLGTPILSYDGNRKPSVSYGPPYPPKPFKAYGVPDFDEEEEEVPEYGLKILSHQQTLFNNDPIFSSVQSAATVNQNPNFNQNSNFKQRNPGRKRRPYRQETQQSTLSVDQQPQEQPFYNLQPQTYDDFLRETFTERSEALQSQETRRRRVRPSVKTPIRASNHQYEVTTEAVERQHVVKQDWKPSNHHSHHQTESAEFEWQD